MNNLLKFSALFGSYVLVLHAFDGPWRNWTKKGENSTFDTWTLTHFVWGGIAREFDIDLKTLNMLGVGNEIAEYSLRKIKFMGLWGEPETPTNMAVDLIAAAAGWKTWDLTKNGF